MLADFDDPEIVRWNLRRFDGADEVELWIHGTHDDWAAERSATWAVRDEDGGLVGRVTVYLRLAEGQGEVTYWVVPEARGRGVLATDDG